MARRKLPYKAGDVIRVPFSGGEALGVIARADGTGGALGYFYLGKKVGDVPALRPELADLVCMFGDLGLLEGKWTVVGPLPGFAPAAWPIPLFAHQDPVSMVYYLRTYGEELGLFQSQARTTDTIAARHPRDGVYGAGAVESSLERLASKRAAAAAPPRRKARAA